jgi:5-methylcytosine-specific restriction endonuclease McrA
MHRPLGWHPAPRRPQPGDAYYGTLHWKKLRAAALLRDGGQCTAIEYGQRCTQQAVVADHIVPRREGGADALGNLQSLCHRHNALKHGARGGAR